MPVYEETAAPTYPVIEEYTSIDAEVVSVEERDSIFHDDDGKLQRKVAFKFRALSDEYGGPDRRFYGDTPTTWSSDERCKLRMWAQQIMNRPYAKGEALNTDDLVGKHCRIVMGVRTKKATGDKTNFVSDVLPAKGVAAAVPPPPEDEPF